MSHFQYETKLNHKADFRVQYRFYTEEENGRKTLPRQGYRSDFWYEHPAHTGTNQLFMIWPEFEDESHEIVLDTTSPVKASGTARMWVIAPQRRTYHSDKIHVGLTGYFMEGNRKAAECVVIEILGLTENPTD